MRRLMLLFLTALLAVNADAAPPPARLLASPAFDDAGYRSAYRDAKSRGVDAPNPRFGPNRRPFGPEGVISSAHRDGSMNVPIFLVDFPDNVQASAASFFDSLGYAHTTFSLARYYGEVSYGQLEIGTVDWPSDVGWTRAPHTYAYYVDGYYGWGTYPQNSQGLCADVCSAVDGVVNFADYDNDGDGIVDGVNIIFAGPFDGTPNSIWPHAWSLPGNGALHDGVWVQAYSVQDEYNNTPGDQSADVLCHEFGHVLGLPDLYDYGYDSWGVGEWCLMGWGVYNGNGWSPAHLSAWCRAALGFVEPLVVTTDDWYTIPAVEQDGTIYRLWTQGQPSSQYFLAENRRPIGYDAALPGHGILIWHVDDSVGSNDNQWYPGYTQYGHFHVALEQADGLWQLEKYMSAGDGGDPYPGTAVNRSFTAATTPSSRDYANNDTQCAVESVPNSANSIEAYLRVGVPGGLDPMALTLQLISQGTARLSWAPVENAAVYDIWRSASPRFPAHQTPWQTVGAPGVALDLTAGIGDASLDFFYVGRARSGVSLSPLSNIVGETDFELTVP
ncbi:MAG: M6 family metalloprotease domain-containing protein [Candidatus Eisenbacteria bacterium]|jgi:immune inhibitor A|nr:M6 family metalloprotease domain-containing protein [Candidatus Eisenbacteria bacterium]